MDNLSKEDLDLLAKAKWQLMREDMPHEWPAVVVDLLARLAVAREAMRETLFEERGFIAVHESGEVDKLSFIPADEKLSVVLVKGWRWVEVVKVTGQR